MFNNFNNQEMQSLIKSNELEILIKILQLFIMYRKYTINMYGRL